MSDAGSKTSLLDEIREFRQHKLLIAVVLLLLALLGWVIPIIPGFILVLLAIALFRRGWMTKIRRRWRLWKIKQTRR